MPFASMLLAVLALAVVLGLILLAGRLARAGGLARGSSGTRLSTVQSLALDPRRRLHLVRCDGRDLLLLTGGGGDVAIGWIEPPAPVP